MVLGSFLIGAYDLLLDWHLNYFKKEIDKLLSKGLSEKQIKNKLRYFIKSYSQNKSEIGQKYVIHLTSRLKKNILVNNLFGVDIDNNAVDITNFSLCMKALENASKEELYEDVDLFNERLLPRLDENIKCGNSLIESEIWGLSKDFMNTSDKTLNTFDWSSEGIKDGDAYVGRGFPSVMKERGFDCVIGNPPLCEDTNQ